MMCPNVIFVILNMLKIHRNMRSKCEMYPNVIFMVPNMLKLHRNMKLNVIPMMYPNVICFVPNMLKLHRNMRSKCDTKCETKCDIYVSKYDKITTKCENDRLFIFGVFVPICDNHIW